MAKYSRRHVSLREDVYRLLEDRARRRGFPTVAGYISHLAALDEMLHRGQVGPLSLADYARAAMAAGVVLDPSDLAEELRRALEAGGRGSCWDAVAAYRSCIRRRGRGGARLCRAAVDLALEKTVQLMMVEAPLRCSGSRGYTIVLDVDREREKAAACMRCYPAGGDRGTGSHISAR